MKEIELTHGYKTIIDDEDYELVNKYNWYYHNGYATTKVKVNGKRKHIYIHRLVNNTPDGLITDHINGDRLNNRRSNLRSCTDKQNLRNRKKRKDSKGNYKGVVLYKRTGKWQAYIMKDSKQYHLGYFNKEKDAAKAYNKKAVELFGEFARLNDV